MRKRILFTVAALFAALSVSAQSKAMPGAGGGPGGGGPGAEPAKSEEFMQVDINRMSPATRERITQAAELMQQRGGATRGVVSDILKSAVFGGVSSVIDVATTEIIHLATYRKEQKNKWLQLIQNENNYTDSISSIRGLKDFYQETSRYGALDPSNINFDGISICGKRDGEQVVFISCHIDTTRLDHLFQHSKFYLVVDSIVFNPYKCHLPNLSANGIRLAANDSTERDNRFLYTERTHLNVGMELTLTSSWVNEAVFVQRDVQLGTFKLNITIPDSTDIYTYSRRAVERNKELMQADPTLRLDTTTVSIEGDCFIVPRSYMPLNGEQKMWGTGEYNIKVKFRESCQFKDNVPYNEKLKHWRKDYKQLLKMQKKGSEVSQYFKDVWKQNGTTLMKSMIKQGLTTGASAAGLSSSGGGAGGAGGMGGAGGAAQGGASSAGGASGQPSGMGGMPQK